MSLCEELELPCSCREGVVRRDGENNKGSSNTTTMTLGQMPTPMTMLHEGCLRHLRHSGLNAVT